MGAYQVVPSRLYSFYFKLTTLSPLNVIMSYHEVFSIENLKPSI